MAKIQANEYAYATLSSVREAINGRLQSIEIPASDEVYPNGVLFHKGDLVEGETHVFTASEVAQEGELPWVLAMPEINTQEYRRIDNALGKFRNKTGKALVGAKLSVDDVLTYSDTFFAETPEVGDFFDLKLGGEKFTKNASPSAGALVFQVIEVKDAFLPTFVGGDGNLVPQSVKEVCVMVVKKQA